MTDHGCSAIIAIETSGHMLLANVAMVFPLCSSLSHRKTTHDMLTKGIADNFSPQSFISDKDGCLSDLRPRSQKAAVAFGNNMHPPC